jgi:hypothetical protein
MVGEADRTRRNIAQFGPKCPHDRQRVWAMTARAQQAHWLGAARAERGRELTIIGMYVDLQRQPQNLTEQAAPAVSGVAHVRGHFCLHARIGV